MTVNDAKDLKAKIDEACDAIAEEVKDSVEGSGILICYHGHYGKVAFSIFRSTANDTVEHKSELVDFTVDNSVALDEYLPIMDKIEKLLATREV